MKREFLILPNSIHEIFNAYHIPYKAVHLWYFYLFQCTVCRLAISNRVHIFFNSSQFYIRNSTLSASPSEKSLIWAMQDFRYNGKVMKSMFRLFVIKLIRCTTSKVRSTPTSMRMCWNVLDMTSRWRKRRKIKLFCLPPKDDHCLLYLP